MKTLARSILVAGVAVVVLAAVLVALLAQPAAQTAEGVVFAAAEPVDVEAVEVENATGTYRYYYEGDGYVLDDIPGTIADLDAFIAFMTGCGSLSAIRQVADTPLPEYGLASPAATAKIQFFDGEALTVSVGSQEQISGNYYVTVEGWPGVYLMAKALAEPFLQPKTQIISKTLTPPLAVSSPLSAIRDATFSGGGLATPVSILATAGADAQTKLDALSFGTATHLVRGVGTYQLDQTYGVEVLGSLFGIPAREVVGYNLSEEEILAMGFDEPWMTVEYDMVNGADAEVQHQVLQLVRLDDATFYAALQGAGTVFEIGRQPFMDIQFEKLPLRWFLTPLLMDLSAVTVEGGGEPYRFEIDNTDSRDPTVTCQGEPVDLEAFRSFFRLITSAAHDGSYLGRLEPPADEAMLTLTYEYADAGKTPDVMALYPGDVRRANVFVNGAGEFAMKDQFAARVLEGCAQVLAGQPVEENW